MTHLDRPQRAHSQPGAPAPLPFDGILIDGVTGAGKSQTLAALRANPDYAQLQGHGRIFYEEETLGELMDELEDPSIPAEQHLARLEQVLAELEQQAARPPGAYGYVLERFHLTYYALMPSWQLFEPFDRRLRKLGCIAFLLHYDTGQIEQRSLERADRRESGWAEGMRSLYGSQAQAVAAIEQSQQRRLDSIALSQLPIYQIDTTAMDWTYYAQMIIQRWRAQREQAPGELDARR